MILNICKKHQRDSILIECYQSFQEQTIRVEELEALSEEIDELREEFEKEKRNREVQMAGMREEIAAQRERLRTPQDQGRPSNIIPVGER